MIQCIGVGPGSLDYLTMKSLALISEADVVAGFDSVLNVISPVIPPQAQIVTMNYSNQVQKLSSVAESHRLGLRCIVAFMGDIHFSGFQYLERVENACGHPVETIPGISSSQLLASKAKICFDETTFITFHRRGDLDPFRRHLVRVLEDNRNAIVLPRPYDFMPVEIAQYLLDNGINGTQQIEIWENLCGLETSWSGSVTELASESRVFSDMTICLVRSLTKFPSQL